MPACPHALCWQSGATLEWPVATHIQLFLEVPQATCFMELPHPSISPSPWVLGCVLTTKAMPSRPPELLHGTHGLLQPVVR